MKNYGQVKGKKHLAVQEEYVSTPPKREISNPENAPIKRPYMRRLRLERELKGFSQANLAKAAKCYARDICMVENGQSANSELLERIAGALDWTNEPDLLLEAIRRGDVI